MNLGGNKETSESEARAPVCTRWTGGLERTEGDFALASVGDEMYSLVHGLYPICRSITGDGLRQSLRLLGRIAPLTLHEIPSGTRVFDWEVPPEWNVRDAYVKDPQGRKVIDFQRSNLHLVSYSRPIHERMPLAELRKHLHSLPDKPDWIPYRTTYYNESWGFCLSERALQGLADGEYEVYIDSSLAAGFLTYGECYLPGQSVEEVLVSCHCCHPSLCNDNLSGMAVSAFLARRVAASPRRYSYRFLFIPGTIGSIAWLSLNEVRLSLVKHGLVVACVGDGGQLTYKRSRRGNAEIDRAVEHVLRHSGQAYKVEDFSPYGYDERQYCSPGIDLPVGSLTRTPHGCYPEYHTSADNLDLIRPEHLADSLAKYSAVFAVLEGNRRYLNTNPKCEPQLGRRGLYAAVGGRQNASRFELALLWVLNLSDGSHSLLDVAERADLDFATVKTAADALIGHGLLVECPPEPSPSDGEKSLRLGARR